MARYRRSATQPHLAYRIFRVVAIVAVVLGFIVPIGWMVLASFKLDVDIYNAAKTFLFTPTIRNYLTVFAEQDFLRYFLNSLIIGAGSTGCSLLLGVPAAYAIARSTMRRSANVVLLARVIPSISLIVPWYAIFAWTGLVGGYPAVIIAHMFTALPLIVWIMMPYYQSLPVDLEEAGQVDGLTPIGAFLRVSLPLSAPGIATAAILAFVFSWNMFLFSLVLTGSQTRTLPVAIMNFIGYASIDWGGLMAATTSITVPIMVIAIFFQKYVVAGMTAGAQKG
jgi:multiple sugar transport system permease protein